MTVEQLLFALGFVPADGLVEENPTWLRVTHGLYVRKDVDAHLRYNLGCAGLDQDAGELVADLTRDLEEKDRA